MRVSVLGVAALLASTSLGSADDIMAGYYGNTLVATTAESQIHFHYRADHTFDASGTDAAGPIAFKGMWSLNKMGALCRIRSTAPPKTDPFCEDWSAHAVGDSWEIHGVAFTLIEGIQ
jgi:hypothetical protein